MSSFLFLTFCVYVFCCLGLHFSAVPLSNPFFRWLFTAAVQTSTGVSHGSNRAGLWLCWCCSLPRPLTGQKSPHRAEFSFILRTKLPLPLKGEGLGFAQLGVLRFSGFAHNCPTRFQRREFGALLVSFFYLARKIAHRLSQGRVWFLCLLAGASQEDHLPFGNPV